MNIRPFVLVSALALGFGCGSSSSSSPTPTSPSPQPSGPGGVSIVSGASSRTTNAYSPNPITIAVGGSVTWTNTDAVAHTSTSDSGAWNSGNIAPGTSFSQTFAAAGTFKYHCALHPGMVGSVTVQ